MITWDINITTLVVFACGVIAFYLGVLRSQDKQAQIETELKTVLARFTDLQESQRMLILNFTAYKEQMANEMRELVTVRNSLEMETRFSKHISDMEERVTRSVEGLGKRLDMLVGRMLVGPKEHE